MAIQDNSKVTAKQAMTSINDLADLLKQSHTEEQRDDRAIRHEMAETLKTLTEAQQETGYLQRRSQIQQMRVILDELKRMNDGGQYEEEVKTFEKAVTELERSNSILGKVSKDLRGAMGSIPEPRDFLRGFIENSNPILKGMLTASMGVVSYVKDMDDKAKSEAESAAKQAKINERNAKELESSRERLDDVATTISQQVDAVESMAKAVGNPKPKSPRSYPTVERLDQLKDLTQKQNDLIAGMGQMVLPTGVTQVPDANGQVIAPPSNDNTEVLEWINLMVDELSAMNDTLKDMKQYDAEMIDAQRNAAIQAEKAALQQAELIKEAAAKDNKPSILSPEEKKKTGIGEIIAEALGSIIGAVVSAGALLAKPLQMLKGITKIFDVGVISKAMEGMSGLGKVFAPIAKVAGFVGKLAGKVIPFVAVLTSIYDFFDGFFNADKILGKTWESLNLADKISAAVGNMLGSLLGIFDWIAGLFGFDTNIGETVKTAVAKGLSTISNGIISFIEGIWDIVSKLFTGDFSGAWDSYKDMTSKMIDGVFSGVKAVISSALDIMPFGDKIKEALGLNEEGKTAPEQATPITEKKGPGASFRAGDVDARDRIEQAEKKIDDKRQAAQGKVNNTAVDARNIQQTTNVYGSPISTRNEETGWGRRAQYGL